MNATKRYIATKVRELNTPQTPVEAKSLSLHFWFISHKLNSPVEVKPLDDAVTAAMVAYYDSPAAFIDYLPLGQVTTVTNHLGEQLTIDKATVGADFISVDVTTKAPSQPVMCRVIRNGKAHMEMRSFISRLSIPHQFIVGVDGHILRTTL